MQIAASYSFNGGLEAVENGWGSLLLELEGILAKVDAGTHKTKVSQEKTMQGRMLYSPPALNKSISELFDQGGWAKKRVRCDYPTDYYRPGYDPKPLNRGAFREMDFMKDRLGVEIQFGKYAFMVYNVCAEMTIFHNLDHIDAGVEIVPVKSFADGMSSGVSYFEQFVWDLEARGVSDIDSPVLILGIDE
jgi:hypothetical protein